jgi:hypothetical protein
LAERVTGQWLAERVTRSMIGWESHKVDDWLREFCWESHKINVTNINWLDRRVTSWNERNINWLILYDFVHVDFVFLNFTLDQDLMDENIDN